MYANATTKGLTGQFSSHTVGKKDRSAAIAVECLSFFGSGLKQPIGRSGGWGVSQSPLRMRGNDYARLVRANSAFTVASRIIPHASVEESLSGCGAIAGECFGRSCLL
jgi:hypothetical protein